MPSCGEDHEARLRLIWRRLSRLERRAALAAVVDELRAFEGEGHLHCTRVYFWLAVVTACAAEAADATTSIDFWRRPTSVSLRSPDLVCKQALLAPAARVRPRGGRRLSSSMRACRSSRRDGRVTSSFKEAAAVGGVDCLTL